MFSKSSRKCDYNLHVVFESCVFKSNVQRIKQFIKEQLKLHNISYGGGGGGRGDRKHSSEASKIWLSQQTSILSCQFFVKCTTNSRN